MENVVFTQSVMGFNRSQVLEYIDTLVKQLKEQENLYTEKQESLQQEVASLSAKCAENKEDLTLTVDKIKELSAEIEYFKKNNFELKSQTDYYRNLILSKDSEIIALKKDATSLRTHCEKITVENEKWLDRQNQISECLVEASLKAEQIVKEAEKAAENKKQAMVENVTSLSGDVVNLKDEISKVERQLEQSFQKLQKAMADMDESAKTIEKQVMSYKEKTESVVKTEVTKTEPTTKKASFQNVAQARQFVRPTKKSLTETVLDTISKILEK